MVRDINRIIFDEYPSFLREFKKLSPAIKSEAAKAIEDLTVFPQPARLRLEKLKGLKNPDIYTIHLTRNHSHKASFEIRGKTAVMRRVGTHKQIDDNDRV
ncbi:hypothetical protein R84981_002758 [Carnimonas sp. R-84981]